MDHYTGKPWENQFYSEDGSKLIGVKSEIPDHVETRKDIDDCAYIIKENESSFKDNIQGTTDDEPSGTTTEFASIPIESFEDATNESIDGYPQINQLNFENEYETSFDDRYSTINSFDLNQINPIATIDNTKNEATNDGLVIKLHQCPECHYQTFKRGHLTRHLNRHKIIKIPKVYGGSHHCDLCEFQSDFKSNVRRHRRVHQKPLQDPQRCPHCDYQAETGDNLRHHLQLHKNLARVLVYKCEDCDYQTIEKPNFTNHLRSHAQPHEVEMLKCPECEFTTRYRANIARHMRSHKGSSEVPVHQCTQCTYKSKDISHLKRHLARHQEPDELEMHQCGKCDYRTRDKSNLKKHLTYMHKDERKRYRCPDCEYKTSYERNMASHALRHKNPRDLEKYRCYHCDYESIDKRYLREHLRRHDQNVKETKVWHSCVECPYKTKKKFNLIRHMRFCLVVAKAVN